MSDGSIDFHAEVYKVQTLVDGGLRLTLDLPETAIAQAAELMECKRLGIAVKVSIVLINKENAKERRNQQSRWKATEG